MCGRYTIGIFVLIALAATACSGKWEAELSSSIDPVIEEREEKDRSFKNDRDSPIPEEDRPRFTGLAYYDLDHNLRFQVKLNRYHAPQTVRLGTNTGEIRSALRYGYFEFVVQDETCRLQVYRMEDAGGAHLFVPFRDGTSGKETYPSGRYIDLSENTSGTYDLDFNRAYNPFCAYGNNYSCPLPPAENALSVSITAGEKNYPLRAQ